MDVLEQPREMTMKQERNIYMGFVMVQDRVSNEEEQEGAKFDADGNGNDEEGGAGSGVFVDDNVQRMKPRGLMISWNNCSDGNIKILPNDFNFPSMPLPELIRI